MQENYTRLTGIVLTSTPLKENSCVFTLFTKELGIVSCFAHGLSSKNLRKRVLTTPLSYGSYELKKKKGAFHLHDGSSLSLIPKNEFANVTLVGSLLRYIKKTQLEQKPAPALFDLLIYYVKKCSSMGNVQAMHASFLLKLMKHEGMYHETQPLPSMTAEENNLAKQLAEIRSFESLEQISVENSLIEKLALLI